MSKLFIIKNIIFAVLLVLTIASLGVLITYPTYRKQMDAAKERINNQSLLQETKFGTTEYAIQLIFY